MTVALLILALTVCADPPPRHVAAVPAIIQRVTWRGIVVHYHRFPDPWGRSMRQVAARRGLRLDPTVDGYVATRRCDRLGWTVWATVAGQVGRFQQVDCSAPRDLAGQLRRGIALETDFSYADLRGFAARDYGGTGAGRAAGFVWGFSR